MPKKQVRLDEKDVQILRSAQEDGRVPWAQLAREMGMSSPAILSRVRRLYKEGVIAGHTTVLNREALGYETVAYLFVSLASADAETLTAFREAVAAMPEVQEFVALTGEYEYMMRVVLPSPADVQTFVHTKLAKVAPLARVATSLATDEIKFTTNLPLA